MKVRLWGTRGSLPTPGPDTAAYGGNTSCVEVRGDDGTVLILDAGSGIRALGKRLVEEKVRRIDVLLTHLHMDHIQGLGFFAPLFERGLEVHIWGPATAHAGLRSRLTRYLGPPLFPVHLRDVPCALTLHEVPAGTVQIGCFTATSSLVCHPGPTLGYRIADRRGTFAYLPDHEPALGEQTLTDPSWTSGHALAQGVDLLVHDAQYTSHEYEERVGWGHSAIEHTFAFAALAKVRHLVPFHHDPAHDDALLDAIYAEAVARLKPSFQVTPAREGLEFAVPA